MTTTKKYSWGILSKQTFRGNIEMRWIVNLNTSWVHPFFTGAFGDQQSEAVEYFDDRFGMNKSSYYPNEQQVFPVIN